jgi:three-Cys-motif partner protein
MAANEDFFERRNSQAVLKHGILARYAKYFAVVAGVRTKQVAFIDGYAGEGRYEDSTPGSPLLLASQAQRVEMFNRNVKLAFVEFDANRVGRLKAVLSELQVEADQVLHGKFEDLIDGMLDRYQGHAVFLFVDPFGLGISYDSLLKVLKSSSSTQPIDVLYHFSLLSVARMARAAVTDGANSTQNAEQVDRALGPIPWRDLFEGEKERGESTDAAIALALRFGDALHKATRKRFTSIQVRQQPNHAPKYLLMLFSSNAKAHWEFADQASNAYEDWLHHCSNEDYEANLLKQERTGVRSLFEETAPDRKDTAKSLETTSEVYLRQHLLHLLSIGGPARPIDSIPEVYGEMLGKARSRHLRSVIRALYAEQKIDDNGIGDFWTRQISLKTSSND